MQSNVSPMQAKLLAGAGMVCISTLVGILYKVSQAASGGFKYSTTSAICIAEFVKLSMSCAFHVMDSSHSRDGLLRVHTAWSSASAQLSMQTVMQISILSFLYAVNNQLSFFVYTLVDPGTVFLFKAGSTMIVASVQCSFAGKTFSPAQWKAMMLQACGMIIVQYDPCKGGGVYTALAYSCLCLGTVITAISAARNEYLIKNYTISLNVQNAVLYAGGVFFNLLAFTCIPNPNSSAEIGFFDGYDNILAIGVVCSNAFIGLAITAVYKYGDAVVKCIASDITAVLLIIVSVIFFSLKSSLTLWCGVFVVVFAVHLYVDASQTAAPPPKAKEPPPTMKGVELSNTIGKADTAAEHRKSSDAEDDFDEVQAAESGRLIRK
ncbi:unnamed protein product [Polarella glacialis]|uniref:UDP-galactose transporter n=1 Tax=Polarella glacialis TaxID=89957 RepID=A0A813ILA3_POLGL|nr:unnamed protein product [Polarella glacialis]